MRVEIVRIGNSRGIRIPKPMIEQCGFGNTVELCVENQRLVITPNRLREGWEAAFSAAGSAEHDKLLLDGIQPDEFESKEWQW